MISEQNFGKCWKCPSDRELILRAKLNTGWSIHTGNLFQKIQTIPEKELEIVEDVIRRAEQIQKFEVERIGRMLCRLDNMTSNTLGDGKKSCCMCGILFGLFSTFVRCVDCEKAVCEKCRVDTMTTSLEFCVLCKICSENREVWKKSGGWFYGKFPTMSEACQKECISQTSGSPNLMRAYDTWEHRTRDIVRLESFEPPEENHNDHSQYKDFTMSSTPDLYLIEDDESQYIELGSFRTCFEDLDHSGNSLMVQSASLSASCPSLANLEDPPRLFRKASIRRKKNSLPKRIITKISKAMEHT